MHKIIFRNSVNGTPEDWTKYLSDMSQISRRVESENAGEAGVITYDNVAVEFEYKAGSPIYSAFNIDLMSIQRYIIEVWGIKTTGVEVKLFDGLIDFSSLEWPDNSKKISFNVLDKLSALDIITAKPTRLQNINIWNRIGATVETVNVIMSPTTGGLNIDNIGYDPAYIDCAANAFYPGEIIPNGDGFALVKSFSRSLILREGVWYYQGFAECISSEQLIIEYFDQTANAYDKLFNNTEITLYDINAKAESLDALKIIEAIFRKAWSTTPIINKSGGSTFAIPLNYVFKLIDENPFGKHPLDALKMLADSMQCYIFINKLGELVIQKKSALANNGTTQSFDNLKKIDGSKKYFWDKLVDEVEITVNSWVVDDETGDYLQGVNKVAKNPNIKARNSLSKEILVIGSDANVGDTQVLLDGIAATKASEYFNFYGNRHFAYPTELNLYDDILDWELLDNIAVDGEQYFFESLSIDLLGMGVDLDLVSVASYSYDANQAHVIVGEGNEANYSSSGSSASSASAGSATVLNKKLTNLSQMNNTPGLVVQISDYGFTKRSVLGTPNQVSVADGDGVLGDIVLSLEQDIHYAATPTFAGTKLTALTPNRIVAADINNNLVSTDASSWIAGVSNQVIVTDDFDGSVTLSLPQDIHYAATPTFAGTKLTALTPNRIVAADINNNLVSTDASSWIAGVSNQVIVTDDFDGSITLSLPQNIDHNADVWFGSLGLGSSPLAGYAVAIYSDAIGTNNYISESTGWKVNYGGNADFRSIYADEMRVKAFTADIEQALAGSDILAKSVAILSADFVVPSINSTASLQVDDLPGFNGLQNFTSGDWIRLRIFDRSGGGLTVGDVWGNVTLYVNNADGTQSWTFTTQQLSYPNLVSKKIFKGSIVLDYGISGQGIIERTVLGGSAPYSHMRTWTTNPYTSGNYTTLLRQGNLSGITDADFGGALSGYGLYAVNNVYLKGKMFALSGSNVAGWETTAVQLKSPTIQVDVSDVYATAYMTAYSGANPSIGFHVGLNNTNNSNDEWISVGSILNKDGVVEADKYGISYKSYLGTYFELTNSVKNIAGWNFDYEKFSKGYTRLEASGTFSGIGVTNGSVDLVKIGNYTGLNPTLSSTDYTASSILGANFNSITDVSYWSITNTTGGTVGYSTLDSYEGTGCFYIEAYNSSLPKNSCVLEQTLSNVSNVVGKEITFEFKYQHFDPTTTEPEQYLVEIRILEYLNGSYYIVNRSYLNPEKDNLYNTWLSANASGLINPSATSVKVEILFYGSPSVQMSGLMLDTSEIKVYNTVHTFINGDGFLITSSPDTYLKFDGSLNISASEVKVRGFNVSRWIGSVKSTELPYLSARGGEIAFVDYATSSTIKLFDGSFWRSISGELVGLGDTNITTPTVGQVLKFDGTDWVNSSAIGGTGSGDDADLLDGQHGAYYLDWTNTTSKPSPTITLGGDATGAITLTELSGGILTVSVANDSHTHDTQYYTKAISDSTYSVLGHIHDGRYFTETEITANYYDKTYIDANFTTTTNQYSKWIITDGVTSKDVTKDTIITFTSGGGVVADLTLSTMDISIPANTFSAYGHNHDSSYYTETELLSGGVLDTRYYTQTYIDANFTTTSNLYSKWILTDGVTSRDVVKDDTITISGSDGVTTSLSLGTMTIGISPNTYSAYGHNHDAAYLGITANAVSASKWATSRIISLSGDVSGSVTIDGTANVDIAVIVANDSHTHDTQYYTKVLLDGGQLDNRYYTETESDALFMPLGGGSFTGNVIIGSGADIVDRYIKVITGDSNIASVYAVGNSAGHGNVFVGENINFGGGMFFKGSIAINEPRTVDAVSFYRKNYTSEAEVFYYNVLSEGLYMQEELYTKGITSQVAQGTAPFIITSTTLVNNLNADLWDGYEFASYLDQGVRTTDSVTFGIITSGAIISSGAIKSASIEPTNLITGYIPYKSSASLVNSPIYSDGSKIGIGLIPSLYDLEVEGDILANNGWIRTTGSSGWYNETHAGGWYMTDATRIKNYGSKPLEITGDGTVAIEIVNGNVHNGYTSGIMGTGWNLSQDTLEINNITVRNTLRTHVFQKDVVKTVNGYLLVSDAGVIVSATSGTVTFRDDKSASLEGISYYTDENGNYYTDENGNYYVDKDIEDGTEMWVKDSNSTTGEIISVKFKVGVVLSNGGVGQSAYTTYEVKFIEGSYDLLQAGMTASRTSGGTILIDASSTNSPYIDILRDSVLISRFGNLSGHTSQTFGQLAGDGLWTNRLYAEGDVKIKGHLEATSGRIGGFTSDATKIFAGNDIVIDASNTRISLNNGAMAFGYDVGGAGKHGVHLDVNNYWYSDKNFKIGGSGGITYDGSIVRIGSNTEVLGSVTAGNLVVSATGAVQSATYIANQDGWKLSNDGFENNEMRKFELAEDISAGTPVKLLYDGTTTKVAKLKESNMGLLNDNAIYDDGWEVLSVSLQGNYIFSFIDAYANSTQLNDSQWVAMDESMGTNQFSILVINFDSNGNLDSYKETVFTKEIYIWNSVTYYLLIYSKKLTKTSNSTCFLKFGKIYELNNGMEKHYVVKFAQLNIATDGTASITNVSSAIHNYSTDGSAPYSSEAYKLYNSRIYEESFSLTNILLGNYLIQQSGSTYPRYESVNVPNIVSAFRTTDGKLVGALTSSVTSGWEAHTISLSGTSISSTATYLGRSDWQFGRPLVRMGGNKFAFGFAKTSDNSSGIFIILYSPSTGNLTIGNTAVGFGTGPRSVAVFNDALAMVNSYIIRAISYIPDNDYKVVGFTNPDIGQVNGKPVELDFLQTEIKTRKIQLHGIIGSTKNNPSFIRADTNKILRFTSGNLGTASDFTQLSDNKYALVRRENFASTDYLMFTIVERDAVTGYSFYANDLIVASANVGTASKIQKISGTHFLVKNGAYIYLIKLVGTVLSLVDTYYDTAITNYNQAFAKLIAGSKYVFMGASKAIILDIVADNLTATSYATTTSTLIANIVGISDTEWVGAYPFNSGGYKATYRLYTWDGTAVTYTDLINTTLVSSTGKIYLAPIRGNVILSMAIADSGNGIISIEELYSTGAATQDSREYPSNLFPSVDGLQRLNSEGYGGILGDNIVHITINGGTINTRFATNLIEAGITVDNRSITSAPSGDMLLYVKGDFVESNVSGGMDAIVIDIINDSFYVDGIMEQTGLAGEIKKVAMVGDETRVFTNLIPGTRYGLNFDDMTEVVENYNKELILAVETNKAIVL